MLVSRLRLCAANEPPPRDQREHPDEIEPGHVVAEDVAGVSKERLGPDERGGGFVVGLGRIGRSAEGKVMGDRCATCSSVPGDRASTEGLPAESDSAKGP